MKLSIPAACVVLLASIAILHGQAIKLSPEQAQRARAATELRLSYAASKDYDPYNADVAEAKKKCSELMKQKVFASAIDEADRGLRADKYNIDLLIAKAAAYRALGNREKAARSAAGTSRRHASCGANSGAGPGRRSPLTIRRIHPHDH
jgi:tetratricopeptide (TPR) repeat protein